MTALTCFKAYDIRGRVGVDIDADIARRIGQAFSQVVAARRVVVGHDPRRSSPELVAGLSKGLMAAGVEVLQLGLCGTEEVYFATGHLGADGGIAVTASHNPADWNGMKLVGPGAAPLSEAAFQELRLLSAAGAVAKVPGGRQTDASASRADYVARVLSLADLPQIKPLKVLVNAGYGGAGPTFDAIAEALATRGVPLYFERLHHRPDGSFPLGAPNPILAENHAQTGDAVRAHGADLGVAWDGDFDRCFFFDAGGNFVPGEHIVGLLAQAFLARTPGAVIAHDPRVVFSIRDVVAQGGGQTAMVRTGHAHFKRALRQTGAIYGGEMSAHHYFRDFYCCDSGMIPWLLIAELMGRTGNSLADLVAGRIARFPSSGEINFRLDDADAAIARVLAALEGEALARDDLDGISLTFRGWRMNLRRSNTEPLLRLNVETEGDADLLAEMTARLTGLISG